VVRKCFLKSDLYLNNMANDYFINQLSSRVRVVFDCEILPGWFIKIQAGSFIFCNLKQMTRNLIKASFNGFNVTTDLLNKWVKETRIFSPLEDDYEEFDYRFIRFCTFNVMSKKKKEIMSKSKAKPTARVFKNILIVDETEAIYERDIPPSEVNKTINISIFKIM
jgi:hypothetical protein